MSQTSTLKGQCIAEFLGTGLLIFFGVGCVAALKVAGASFGQWEISVIWGLGVAMAIYLTAGVSGAHLNPAVTIALWLFACFDKRKVIPFIVSQVAGAFCAAALVYGLYYNLFFDFEQTHHIVRGSVESVDLAGGLGQCRLYRRQRHSLLPGAAFRPYRWRDCRCICLPQTDWSPFALRYLCCGRKGNHNSFRTKSFAVI